MGYAVSRKRKKEGNLIKTKLVEVPPEYSFAYCLPIGDLHTGDPEGIGGNYINEKEKRVYNRETLALDKMIAWILSVPNAYVFGMGDWLDVAIKNSIANTQDQKYNLDTGPEYLYQKFYPLAQSGQLIGIFDGNHCERIIRQGAKSPMKALAERLGVTYFPNECAYLFWRVGNGSGGKGDKYRPFNYTMLLHHGRGGGRTPGGKLNKVWQLRDMAPADIYVMGHVHGEIAYKDMYPVPDIRNSKLNTTKRYYLASGCWLGWASYAKIGMYGMSTIGAPRIRMNGEHKEHGWDVHVSL